jgi:hypothetical protein
MRGPQEKRGARGSITPLVLVLVLATGGLCLGLGRLGSDAVDAGLARTAADAAALAGAAGGERAARLVAEANGGVLVAFADEGAEVEVRVRVGRSSAVARAAGEEVAGGAARAGLQPEVLAALRAAERLLGTPVPITSGWRSAAQQRALWDARASNPYPVAPPGTSAHERGEAVDVPRAVADRLASVGAAVGLCRPLPRSDPVHFELCRPTRGP